MQAVRIGWAAGGAAVAAGVALFAAPMLWPGYLPALPRAMRDFAWPGSPLLAPLFAGPLMVLAVQARRLPTWGAVGLAAAITAIHVGAVALTAGLYVPHAPTSSELVLPGEATANRAAQLAKDRDTARREGLAPGAVGGAMGAAASLLLTGLVLRARRTWATTLTGTAVLALVGALGVSRMTQAVVGVAAPTLAGLWPAVALYALYQAILGALIVVQMAGRRGSAKPETDNLSPKG